MQDQPIRLNKFIAQHLSIGRRAADQLIEKGKVLVNDVPTDLGSRVFRNDKVQVEGKLINRQPKLLYVLMDKPVGYVCSRRQQGESPTIFTLLPPEYQHLKPAGRLDKDSSGLLLLTNDGDFAHRMTHPSFVKTKVYEVELDKPLEPLHHQMIVDFGINLPDGVSKFQLQRLKDGNSQDWQVTMHEGRNRQIRRTFAILGYEVKKLRRIKFGNYNIESLNAHEFIIDEPR